ncbi:unnamed protein product, partial [Staurois parvus]
MSCQSAPDYWAHQWSLISAHQCSLISVHQCSLISAH